MDDGHTGKIQESRRDCWLLGADNHPSSQMPLQADYREQALREALGRRCVCHVLCNLISIWKQISGWEVIHWACRTLCASSSATTRPP